MKISTHTLAFLAVLFLSTLLHAQDLTITDAYCGDKPAGTPATRKSTPACRLGDTLTLEVGNLGLTDPSTLVLALDGRLIKNTPVFNAGASQLQFELKRSDGSAPGDTENRAVWKEILSRARQTPAFSVGIGTADKISAVGPKIWLLVYPAYTWVSGVFLAILLVVFLVLAKKSDIIRDPAVAVPGKELCYSLARSQMAWWLFIALASYHYIWLVTGDRDSLTPSVLILMGISAATGLGAVAIDGGKRDQRAKLETERTQLNADILTLTGQINSVRAPANTDDWKAQVTQKRSRLGEVETSLKGLPGGTDWTSEGFLKDILRDNTGVSFHRFQLATWTVVLGFVFIVSVFQNLAMPDFSTTLLALMGVSSGTYIGFKIPDPPK